MAASYFGCSMVRTCLQDWTSLFLHEAKGLPISTAARCLFLWELGGFAGTFAAGAISDKVFGGRRGPVVCICCALLAPSLLCLLHATSPLVVQLCYLWMGVCAFPVHVLLGLFSREVVPPAVSSSAGGFVKMIAQIGGASAGAQRRAPPEATPASLPIGPLTRSARRAGHLSERRRWSGWGVIVAGHSCVHLPVPRRLLCAHVMCCVLWTLGMVTGYPLGMLQQKLGWEGVYWCLALVAASAAAAAAPLWNATAAIKIKGRNGTVQDFNALKRSSSRGSEKDLFKKMK
jgi:sugar phosphate permease